MPMSRVALATAVLGIALVVQGTEPEWTDEQKHHWSFLPPLRAPIPAVVDSGWIRNPIDAFILRDLERLGLAPAREADRTVLIRRLTFDLTGLPPTPHEVDCFVRDSRTDAYERLVDRILDSPQYGERWARAWLDLARFAESDGFKSDKTRPNAWRYRDWVVRALNADLPYNRFVQLQIAGEEVAPSDPDAFIASAFNRHWPFEDNNKVPGLDRQLMLEDMTDTTTAVFLGLTVACARCHDHKYDPISQKDYYRVEALFAATAPQDDRPLAEPFDVAVHGFLTGEHRARVASVKREVQTLERPYLATLLKDKLAKLPAEVRKAFETVPEKRSAFQEDLLEKHAAAMVVDPKTMRAAMSPETRRLWEERSRVMAVLAKEAPSDLPRAIGMITSPGQAQPVRLLRKGNYANPAEAVAPGFPSVLSPGDASFRERPLRRKALAEWLTQPQHPLTARVMVNRLWQGHFGRGIVATPSDFGTQGAPPSHPELLDWLATELVARGWSLKAIHRLMVTSATYRQSSMPSAQARESDPDNLLFSRMPRRRLEAEAVRDALLAVSGQLDSRIGGPSVFPDLPPGITTRGGWTRSHSAADRNRRSLYVFVRRNLKYPLFDAFDAPDTNVTCPERNVSVNAPQALMLLNSDLVLDIARAFARRVEMETRDLNDLPALVRTAYCIGLGREPSGEESARGAKFLREASANDGSGSEALVDLCHAVVNLNEFVFVD